MAYAHNASTLQTDRQTTLNSNTVLCVAWRGKTDISHEYYVNFGS